jgi:glutathione peroxidase
MKRLAAFLVLPLAMACSSSETPAPLPEGTSDAGSTPTKDAGSILGTDAGAGADADAAKPWECLPAAAKGSFYELSSPNLGASRTVSMCEYRGQVALVVNVASQCGYTPQYAPLEVLYQKYIAQGFVVLGFPCNQFGGQEPGTDTDISTFCTKEYGITFPMFTKSNVNAPTENPIYTWLKAQPGGAGNITWNFNKFLLSRDGKLLKRYDSAVAPDDPILLADVEAALK